MAKFISHDGVDKNGIRAEVTVQTGTGVISEIVGRGKPKDDGTFRNVEVVFTPDNPMLKRKVYGLLDTTATDLWEYVQKAHSNQSPISYRIESQRRNGVDRETPIGELNATEQVRRILAGIDGVFSHEAKTNPIEDPDNENPSALTQAPPAPAAATTSGATAATVSVAGSLQTLDTAIGHALPMSVIAAAAAQALHSGADPNAIHARLRNHPASEDTGALFLGDGTINYSSPAIEMACQAEQFALDHLIRLYTPARSTTPITVSDEVIAQAASLAVEMLTLTDEVIVHVATAPYPGRHTKAYQRAFSIVCDAIDHRHAAPIGGTENDTAAWRANILDEARDRMRGLASIAQNTIPSTASPAPEPQASESHAKDTEPSSQADGDLSEAAVDGFEKPGPELVQRIKQLCIDADVAGDPRKISDWLERELGARMVSEIHAPTLEAFIATFEQAGPETVRAAVLN